MLKKLRVRMIFSAVLAFALVIIFVSVLVNVVNYRIVTRQADDTLAYILDFENRQNRGGIDRKDPASKDDMPPVPPFMGMSNPESGYITRFFVVKLKDDGSIISVSTDRIASVDSTEAGELARSVLEKKADHGYVQEYRFIKGKNADSNTVIFLNVMQNQQHLKILGVITLFVALVSLIIVSVLVIIFSGTAIKPIAANIGRQKQFITDASHELKTPLTSIMTSLDVIAMEYGDDEWTDNIRSQSERMSKLVSEMVILSKLDEENPVYNREKFLLSEAVWEMVEIYQSQAKASGKAINVNISDNIFMNGDKGLIQQLLSVLLDNAVRYSRGDGDIEINVSEDRSRIKMEVSNPCRFDRPVDVDRLFDRFYRPDSSRNANDGGSGIGLAIAKTVTEIHGGTITAKCPEGKKMIIRVII